MGGIASPRINEYFQFPLQRTVPFYTLSNNMTCTVSHSQQYDSVSRVLVKLIFHQYDK